MPLGPTPAAREALIAATAMALYEFNVSHADRAEALRKHRRNPYGCVDSFEDQVQTGTRWATAMGPHLAEIYQAQALSRYGDEARKRVGLIDDDHPRADYGLVSTRMAECEEVPHWIDDSGHVIAIEYLEDLIGFGEYEINTGDWRLGDELSFALWALGVDLHKLENDALATLGEYLDTGPDYDAPGAAERTEAHARAQDMK